MSLTANAARPALIESLPKKPRLTKLTSALSFLYNLFQFRNDSIFNFFTIGTFVITINCYTFSAV